MKWASQRAPQAGGAAEQPDVAVEAGASDGASPLIRVFGGQFT